MTQGYGADNGQQGQWGQGGQNPPPAPQPPQQQPQWGQPSPAPQPQWGSPEQAPQPQWGQPSPQSAPQFGSPSVPPQWGEVPVAAPGGYPGAAGHAGASFGPGDGVNWARVKMLGLILLIGTALLLLTRLGINLTTFIGADEIVRTDSGGTPGALGIGTGLTAVVLFIVNLLLSLVMMTLGIIAAVSGRGRARVGGIVVAVAIPVSVVLYWVLSFIVAILLFATGAADATTGELTAGSYRISSGVDALRTVLMVAIIGLGSSFVHSTAAKKLSA